MANFDPCSNLSIDVYDLLRLQGFEKERLEFKKQWHNKRESRSRGTYWQILQTICAFANDYYNNGGGYIIIGVQENKDRPPSIVGLPVEDLDRIQKEITGACRTNIKPEYLPVISPQVVEVDGEKKNLLVIWAITSSDRPHRCREKDEGQHQYFIRQATVTKRASEEEQRQLSLFLYNRFPFDDRKRTCDSEGYQLSEDCIEFDLVRTFSQKIDSKIVLPDVPDPIQVYRKMKLLTRIGDKVTLVDGNGKRLVPIYVPKNVALMLFNPKPHKYFKGAKTDIAVYSQDTRNGVSHVTNCRYYSKTGPIDQQIENVLSLISENISEGAYPAEAIRETITNAFLHRGYEECYSDPISIKITPNFIDVYSYPGPDPSLTEEHFTEGNEVPMVRTRNSRILEFFRRRKLAEGWNTGVRTIIESMKTNNNPAPIFKFTREYFHVRLRGLSSNCNAHLEVQKGDVGGKDHDKNHDADHDDNGTEDNNGSEQNSQPHGLFPDSAYHRHNLPTRETRQHGMDLLTEDPLLNLSQSNSVKLWLKRSRGIPEWL